MRMIMLYRVAVVLLPECFWLYAQRRELDKPDEVRTAEQSV